MHKTVPCICKYMFIVNKKKMKLFFFALALDVSHYLVGNASFDIYKTDHVEKGACELCAIITKRTCHFLTFNCC